MTARIDVRSTDWQPVAGRTLRPSRLQPDAEGFGQALINRLATAFLPSMADPHKRAAPEEQAKQRVQEILQAADSWAKEVPAPLRPATRAVCIRLAEMVADQRHYLSPLPEPQESERRTVLTLTADQLRSKPVVSGVEQHLTALEELELRSTGSWAIMATASAQNEWITTAIRYLESCAGALPAAERPDSYWADDVVAGIIASVRALIGIDELHARTEARYSGATKRVAPED